MKRTASTGLFLLALALAACLPQATRTSPVTGDSEAVAPGDAASGSEAPKDSGSEPGPPADAAANQPGPGGSMPSGTLAPPPLVPINFAYKAEGFYCRFAGEPARSMIWGKLYRKAGDGQFEGDFTECGEPCAGKGLAVSYRSEGAEAADAVALDESSDFRFLIATGEPSQFSLVYYPQPKVAVIGQETPAMGAFVDVSGFQAYKEDGQAADCPSFFPLKAPFAKRPVNAPVPAESRAIQIKR